MPKGTAVVNPGTRVATVSFNVVARSSPRRLASGQKTAQLTVTVMKPIVKVTEPAGFWHMWGFCYIKRFFVMFLEAVIVLVTVTSRSQSYRARLSLLLLPPVPFNWIF